MHSSELKTLPPGVKLLVENDCANLLLPLDLIGRVLDALSTLDASDPTDLPAPPSIASTDPPLVEPQFARLAGTLTPNWFSLLYTLYAAHATQPNPILKASELGTRAGVSETTIYRYVRAYREGSIEPANAQQIIRHFVLEIRQVDGPNSPNQFVLRELGEALATCPF